GQPVKRLEDQRLLTGRGQFIDDKPEEGALWLHVLRSPHAHAKIISIDTKAARDMTGVETVFTGADLIADDIGTIPTLSVFMRPDGKPMTVPPRRLLAHEIVRFAGEPVAAVVATSRVAAEAVLKRPKESVRVLVGDIGGGFGQKTNLYPEDGMVAYAALKLKRKVRWRGDRSDEFIGGTHGRDLTSTGEFALDAKGRVQAYRVRSIGGTGAYLTGAGSIIPLVLGPFVQSGVYDLPLLHYEVKAVMTNTAHVGAYRGAGRPEGVFIVERLMDAAARQIGMDPRAIRKVNYIKPAQLPYTNAVGQVYDSGAFAHMLSRASELSDWDSFAARKKAAKKKGLLYGRGLTSYIEWTGGRAH